MTDYMTYGTGDWPMRTFLPAIHNEPSVTTQGNGEMNERAALFAQAWLSLLPHERLFLMRYDSRLAQAAQDHAEYLAQRTGDELSQSMHRGEGGSYSNGRVLASGYHLPEYYSPNANNVESCSRDDRDPSTVAIALANHEPHRSHMLGLPGFEDRTVWAVGNAADDWVFLACPPERS